MISSAAYRFRLLIPLPVLPHLHRFSNSVLGPVLGGQVSVRARAGAPVAVGNDHVDRLKVWDDGRPVADVGAAGWVLSELRTRMTRSEAPSLLPCLRRRHFGDQCMPAPDEASSLLGQGDDLAAATASAQVLA